MKTIDKLPNLIFSCLIILLGACREKKSENPVDLSSHPSPENKASLASKETGKYTAPSSLAKAVPTVEQNIQNQKEAIENVRISLFLVPLGETATKDRQEAWDRMAPAPKGWTSEQYQYASNLLDRYADSPPIERLVMWQLCGIRIAYQAPPNKITIGLGGIGVSREKTENKLKETLYSALGKSPEDLPYDEAIIEGIKLLKGSVNDSPSSQK